MKLELHLYSLLLTGESNKNKDIIPWLRSGYSEIPIILWLVTLFIVCHPAPWWWMPIVFSAYTSSSGIYLSVIIQILSWEGENSILYHLEISIIKYIKWRLILKAEVTGKHRACHD